MAVILIRRPDRRSANRLPTPPCPRCGHDHHVAGAIRTANLVYFQCGTCGELLVQPMPAGRHDRSNHVPVQA